MKHLVRRFASCVLAGVLLHLASTHAANAQSFYTETFVSRNGSDSNTCATPSSACLSIGLAFSRTFNQGFVHVIGPVNATMNVNGSGVIDREVTIAGIGDGARVVGLFRSMEIRPSAGQEIVLRNLEFEAYQSATETGVLMTGAGKLTIKDCSFNGLSVPAVEVRGPAGARVVLDNATITNNAGGVLVSGANGAANTAFVQRSLIDNNTSYALRVDGAANSAVISSSTLSGSGGPDLSLLNGGRAVSYRNNVIRSGTPTQTLPTN